ERRSGRSRERQLDMPQGRTSRRVTGAGDRMQPNQNAFFGLLTLCALYSGTVPAYGQSTNLIQAEVDSVVEDSLWTLGPLRLTPQIRLGAGYDSNSLSSAEAPNDDFAATVAPGIRIATAMGNRAIIDVFQELGFVYYQEIEGLRDVTTATRIGGTVGGRRVLFRIEDELSAGNARPTSEFDVPAESRSNALQAALEVALGNKHLLTTSYRYHRSDYEDIVVDPLRTIDLLNRTTHTYGLRLTKRLTAKTSAAAEGSYELMDFEEAASLRDGHAFTGSAGLIFNPKTNVRGEAWLGYKQMHPEFPEQPEYQGLIASVDVQTRLGERLDVTTLYSRDTLPSVVAGNWYFIEHRFGGAVDIYVTRSFYLSPGATFGRNNYPRPTTLVDEDGQLVEERIEDRFDIYSLGFNYRMGDLWTASLEGNYLDRESNFHPFTKDRFYLSFGISTEIGKP
ncbi:MAG: outer membrane beta-barrel protein, partial [Vicinamibacteria bacterium]